MVKAQLKVSESFRSVVGAQALNRIQGYLSTLRKQGLPLLSALQASLCGHPVFPSLSRIWEVTSQGFPILKNRTATSEKQLNGLLKFGIEVASLAGHITDAQTIHQA